MQISPLVCGNNDFLISATAIDATAATFYAGIQRQVDAIAAGKCTTNLLDGACGMGWALSNMVRHQPAWDSPQLRQLLSQLDGLILRSMERCFQQRNYDYFYGAFGYLAYLIRRREISNPVNDQLSSLVSRLSSHTSILTATFGFHGESNRQEQVVELGVAHGTTGQAGVLASFYETANETERKRLDPLIDRLLEGVSNSKVAGMYPDLFERGEAAFISQRWCRGDLGIAMALRRIARLTGRGYLFEEAETSIQHSFREVVGLDYTCDDTSVCHGTKGIRLLYGWWATDTQNETITEQLSGCFDRWKSTPTSSTLSEFGLLQGRLGDLVTGQPRVAEILAIRNLLLV